MAVQMASSPTQDMINFGVSTGGEAQAGKQGEAGFGVFADSASSAQNFAKTLESMARDGKTGEKEGDTSHEAKAAEAVCGEEIAEFSELHVGKSEMALWWRSALECLESENEVDIEALIASHATREKKGRFDPDAILKETGTNTQADSELQTDAAAPESELVIQADDENPDNPGEEDLQNAAALLAAQVVAETATDEAEPSESPDDSSADTEAIEQASSGSVKADKIFTTGELLPKEEDIEDVKYQPKSDGADALGATEALTDDAAESGIDVDVVDSPKPQQEPKQEPETARTVRAETGQQPPLRDVSPQNEKTKPETDASIATETTESVDDVVSPDATAAKKSGDAAEDKTKTDGGERSEGETIEELIARYRQERESNQRDSSNRGSSNQSRRDRNASSASSQARSQRTEAQTYAAARETRDDSPKAGAFAASLDGAVKDARDDLSPAQSASANRSAAPYLLNREAAFSDGVRTVLEFMRVDGTSEARIVVEPPALGHIDVSLRATSAGMEATFKVDNEHLKQMLQQQLDILKSSLQSQGIHVSALAVDIRNRDDQKGREAMGGNGKKSRRPGGIDDLDDIAEGEASVLRLDLEKGLLHWVA